MRTIIALLACALSLGAQPKRIISTAPSLTEILFALGLGDRVVGVTTYCHYPPAETARLPKIGTYLQPNLELVLSLKPDLVIIQKTAVHSKNQFGNLKLNILEVRHNNIAEIKETIRILGDVTGVPRRAAELNASIDRRLTAVQQRVSQRAPVTMTFIVARTPGALEGLIAAGRDSYLDEIIRIAGGRNIFSDSVTSYPKISSEEILSRNPQVILDMGDMADTSNTTPQHVKEVVALWGRYPELRAVKEKRVYAIASDIFFVPGPRVVEAAEAFAKMLHPDLYR
jgi:iron complex transport system substrate-binding protein